MNLDSCLRCCGGCLLLDDSCLGAGDDGGGSCCGCRLHGCGCGGWRSRRGGCQRPRNHGSSPRRLTLATAWLLLLWLVGLLLILGCAYRWRLHRRRWWWRLNCDSDWAGTGAGTYTNLDDATTGTNGLWRWWS